MAPDKPEPDDETEPPIDPERAARFGDDGGPDAFLAFDPDYDPTADDED